MRKLDYEFIFTCGIVAFIAALGMVAGIVVLAGAKIYVYNLPLIVGSFLAIGGLLWGLLLVLNNGKVEKRTYKTEKMAELYLCNDFWCDSSDCGHYGKTVGKLCVYGDGGCFE